jgi:hypothetical protein
MDDDDDNDDDDGSAADIAAGPSWTSWTAMVVGICM